MKFLVTTGLVIVAVLAFMVSPVKAVDYNVTATVPYDPPSIATSIHPTFNNLTVNNNQLVITGTCQVLNPAAIVSLWRQGSSIGSTICGAGGTFSIQVTLLEGANTLTPRTSNLNNLYGPDGAVITITLNTPVVQPPQNSNNTSSDTNSNPASSSPTAQTTISNLVISAKEPFNLLNTDNQVSVEIIVDGGNAPYVIRLNWGDGTSETKEVSASGTYVFTHTYDKEAVYQVKASVTDVLGSTSSHEFIILSKNAAASGKKLEINQTPITQAKTGISVPLTVAAASLGAGIIGASMFILGQHHQLKLDRQIKKKKSKR